MHHLYEGLTTVYGDVIKPYTDGVPWYTPPVILAYGVVAQMLIGQVHQSENPMPSSLQTHRFGEPSIVDPQICFVNRKLLVGLDCHSTLLHILTSSATHIRFEGERNVS